jgi:integrating conjugative element membrane protein (TIGR03747 family)
MAVKKRDGNADGVKSFFWVIDLAIHASLWLLLASMLAVVADLAAAHLLWRDDPVGGIQQILGYYLNETSDPELAARAADSVYWCWFGWTGIDASARAWEAGVLPSQGLSSFLRPAFSGATRETLVVAMYGIKLFGVRIAMLVMTIPQFALAIAVAVVDGLVARHVRRAQGGHESATRYHHAKRFLTFGLIPLTAVVWLVAPVRLPVWLLFWPVSIMIVIAVWNMAKYFKKYT